MLFQELSNETRQPFKESKTVIDINHVIGFDPEIVLNSENKERLLHYSENQLTKSFQGPSHSLSSRFQNIQMLLTYLTPPLKTVQLSDGTSTPDN